MAGVNAPIRTLSGDGRGGRGVVPSTLKTRGIRSDVPVAPNPAERDSNIPTEHSREGDPPGRGNWGKVSTSNMPRGRGAETGCGFLRTPPTDALQVGSLNFSWSLSIVVPKTSHFWPRPWITPFRVSRLARTCSGIEARKRAAVFLGYPLRTPCKWDLSTPFGL